MALASRSNFWSYFVSLIQGKSVERRRRKATGLRNLRFYDSGVARTDSREIEQGLAPPRRVSSFATCNPDFRDRLAVGPGERASIAKEGFVIFRERSA